MKRANVRNQMVTDAQGRRRFHGAFTGGFSAGYYNSVGSKEGWTPRTFSSARGNRSSRIEQRPEDFMDEEDDPLLGKRLETSERYDTLQTGAKRQLQEQKQQVPSKAGVIPEFNLPDDWVLPVNDSIGAKLLKQMGWKEGHGIGLRKRKLKFEDEEKQEPGQLMQDVSEDKTVKQSLDNADEEVYVPPRKVFDLKKVFSKPKLDRYGAGFDPYIDAPEFLALKQHQAKQKDKETPCQSVSFLDALKATDGSNLATSGYGLGALEENDDIDVYGNVSMAEFDRAIAPNGARTEVKRLEFSTQDSLRHNKRKSSGGFCSDGRPVLPGFELAASKEKPPKFVSMRLAVPSGFKPYHSFDDDQDDAVSALYRKFNFSTLKPNNGVVVTANMRSDLLKDDRQSAQSGSGVGVGASSVARRSVFNMLGEDQKAKLFNAAKEAKQGLFPSRQTSTAAVEKTVRNRQPLVCGSDGDQFRATISASIAKRFISSRCRVDENKSDSSFINESLATKSRRSQSLWIPKSLLCKRFHVKCMGPTGSNGVNDKNDKKRDLFNEELVPQIMEYAAERAACHQPIVDVDNPKSESVHETQGIEVSNLTPLPAIEKSCASLLKSIFEPQDEEARSEEDTSDSNGSDEDGREVRDVSKETFDSDLSFGASYDNDEVKRKRVRSVSEGTDDGRDYKRQVKKEKRKHKKHKKHPKQLLSRGDNHKKHQRERKSLKH
ncbi:hypothetical protein PsorP6_009118 [Peronosclerospora sorghi]|uniref:Uncharacterized protein n=1 Tax=Peronosclerospora sorghi TaxID=230839 RepID=A0ACC0W0F9_9STRA|nr:hypothetical protein PsorP6_009118 [Peronosclerospora sorghi]